MPQDHGQEKLIRMANQIATFFMSQPETVRAAGVATHINRFWEPRMRRHLFEYLDSGADGLMPLVAEASAMISRPVAGTAVQGMAGPGMVDPGMVDPARSEPTSNEEISDRSSA